MNFNLSGKTALVCGSTQGIGWSTALELAAMGANVVLMARNEQKLEQLASELPKNADQKHSFMVADFNFPEQVKQEVSKFCENNTIHILINNTGGPPGGPIEVFPYQTYLSDFL